jgi:hypothetical protein
MTILAWSTEYKSAPQSAESRPKNSSVFEEGGGLRFLGCWGRGARGDLFPRGDVRPLEFGFSVDAGRDGVLSVVIRVANFLIVFVIWPAEPYTKKTQMPNALR